MSMVALCDAAALLVSCLLTLTFSYLPLCLPACLSVSLPTRGVWDNNRTFVVVLNSLFQASLVLDLFIPFALH